MTQEQKDAMRQTLDAAIESTIANYHGFMESTVHSKAEALLANDWRSQLIDNMAAAADAAAPGAT